VTPRRDSRWLGFAVAFALTGVAALGLGSWQLLRGARSARQLAEAQAQPPVPLAEALAADDSLASRRVVAEGHLLAEQSVLLDGQVRQGERGVHLLTPLALDGREKLVLVDRGFLSEREAEGFLANDAPDDPVFLEGVLLPLEEPAPTPPDDAGGGAPRTHWQRIELDALERQLGQPLEPVLLVRAATEAENAPPYAESPRSERRASHAPGARVSFALALLAFALGLFALRRGRAGN
jgi:surfeit locus 1 family protein